MQFSPGTRVVTQTAPIVTFDHKSPFVRFYMTALMVWPDDRQQQSYALVTFAAQMIAFVEKKGVKAIAGDDFTKSIAQVAEQMGVSTEAVLSMPLAKLIAEEIIRDASNMRGRLEEELLNPAGGFQALADAPGSKVLTESMDRIFDGPVKHVGYLLLLIARMQKHHPELRPSKNKAMAIVEATCLPPLWPGRKDRALEDHWEGWAAIAPLSAAVWTWIDRRPSDVSRSDWMMAAFTSDFGVKCVIRWAKWFRQFGTTFKASGSSKPLLSPSTTLDYDVDLPPQEPVFHRLTQSEVMAAKGYHARTQKG